MISDSEPWKRQLAADARFLDRAAHETSCTQDRLVAIERRIFVSAYAIRKLKESHKLSDQLERRSIDCRIHAATGTRVDAMNLERIDRLYDLAKAEPCELPLRDYCNQIVHSFVFALRTTRRNGPRGFYVASDFEMNKRLFYLNINDVVALIRAAAADDVISMTSKRDPTDGVMRIVSKSNRELPRP